MRGRDRRRMQAMAARMEPDLKGKDPFELLLQHLAADGYEKSQPDQLATEAFLALPPTE